MHDSPCFSFRTSARKVGAGRWSIDIGVGKLSKFREYSRVSWVRVQEFEESKCAREDGSSGSSRS
jgi:hypothetical protein